MGFLDKLGKLLEMRLKFGYGLKDGFSETKLCQLKKLLPLPELTTPTVLAESSRHRFQSC
jgi:hypothetical protein